MLVMAQPGAVWQGRMAWLHTRGHACRHACKYGCRVVHRHVSKHALRHVYTSSRSRHAYRHLCRNVGGHDVHRQVDITMCTCLYACLHTYLYCAHGWLPSANAAFYSRAFRVQMGLYTHTHTHTHAHTQIYAHK